MYFFFSPDYKYTCECHPVLGLYILIFILISVAICCFCCICCYFSKPYLDRLTKKEENGTVPLDPNQPITTGQAPAPSAPAAGPAPGGAAPAPVPQPTQQQPAQPTQNAAPQQDMW